MPLKELEDVIYVSGHEHNLQYLEMCNDQHFVISGSGSIRQQKLVKNKKLAFWAIPIKE